MLNGARRGENNSNSQVVVVVERVLLGRLRVWRCVGAEVECGWERERERERGGGESDSWRLL